MTRHKKRPEVRSVAAVDPSLTGSAVAVGPADGCLVALEEFGSTPCGMLVLSRIERYESLVGDIVATIDRKRTSVVDVVFIEGYAYASKGRATYDIAEFGYALRRRLYTDFEAVIVEIPPGTLKKFTTGNGNASKDQMLSTVVRTMDPDGLVDTNNKADALALYRLGCQAIGVRAGGYFDETLAKKKQEAVIEANRLYREALRR